MHTSCTPASALRRHVARRGRALAGSLVVALAAGLVACGGGGGDNDAPPATGNVGPQGATVASADGKATLVVPPAAVASPIEVGLAAATDGYQSDPAIVPGSVYRLSTPDIALAQPATLFIAGGASAAMAADAVGRKHALATLGGPPPILCDPTVLHPGDAVPAGTTCYYDPAVIGTTCPTGLPHYAGLLDVYLGLTITNTGPQEPLLTVAVCEAPAQPTLQIATLSPNAAPVVAPTTPTSGSGSPQLTLGALHPGLFGLIADATPPVVHLSVSVAPAGAGMGTLTLSAAATDNVAVSKVRLVKWVTNPDGSVTSSTLGLLLAPPYALTSPPLPLAQIYNLTYAAVAYDSAGNYASDVESLTQAAPAIASFTASPASVPSGGGSSTLAWSVSGATTLSIDHGVGDVTGLASKTVNIATPTTFTLTATNAGGTTTATTSVAVLPQPAPQIASFTATPATLPVGGGNVTLAWTTSNADTLSIDQGIGIVTGGSAVVAVAASRTFTLTATNASGSVTSQAAVTVAAGVDRFVDLVTGLDINPCTQAAPCKTIAHAATGAPAGSTIYLGDGVYPSTQPTATLPDGVGLRALHPGAASLAGLPIIAAGSSVVQDIVFDVGAGFACGRLDAESTTGTPALALSGVLLKCFGSLQIGGNVSATMVPGPLAGGAYTAALPGGAAALITVRGHASLLVQGGTFDGNHAGSAAFGGGLLTVIENGTLTLSGVSMTNRMQNGIAVSGPATLVVKDHSVFDAVGIAGNCPTGSTITVSGAVHVSLDQVQISNSPSAALCVRSGGPVATIAITQTTMASNARGIASETGSGSTAALTASGLTLTGNAYGIAWEGIAGSLLDIAGSTITGNGIGAQVTAGTFRLRGSNVSGNSDVGLAMFSLVDVDLGTQASPGLNTFTGNVNTGLKANLNPGRSFSAVGNTWRPNVQGSDASGRYSVAPAWTPVPVLGPTTGLNLQLLTNVSGSL